MFCFLISRQTLFAYIYQTTYFSAFRTDVCYLLLRPLIVCLLHKMFNESRIIEEICYLAKHGKIRKEKTAANLVFSNVGTACLGRGAGRFTL